MVGVALAIFAGTVWLYWPSVQGGFLTRMDDDEELRQSVRMNGLTWNAVKWAFTTTDPDYYPLQRLTHILDYQIWGKNAAGHHATSVVLHALNAALVFGFLWTLLGAAMLTTGERFAMALGVTVAFAIHPFQAEPVAWMSCRTHLLRTTFGIGCVWAYVAGARRWVVWGLYVAALLCSPIAVSLPFAMLAIDYFPLRRHEELGWGRLVREKAALVVLGVLAAVVTIITESQKGGMMLPLETVTLSQRVLLMFESLTFYLCKLVWPVGLSPFYPLETSLSLDHLRVLLSVLCVGVITVLAVWERQRLPALAAAWGAYVMLVLPVSGLMQRGAQAMALRYAYLAMLPLLLLAGGAVVWAWRHSAKVAHLGLVGLLACELCVFGLRTRRLIPVWRDDETLWRTALAHFPNSEMIHRVLALVLFYEGRGSEALPYAQRAVAMAPQLPITHDTLGIILAGLGRLQEAEKQYEQALQIKPDYAEAHVDLGNALLQGDRLQDAIGHYEQALRIRPDYAEAHYNLGIALAQAGKTQEAMEHYEQALRIKPDYAEAHSNLGFALAQAGKTREAMEHFAQALRIKPDYADAHYNLGIALVRLGMLQEAMGHWERALQVQPNFAEAHYNLGMALEQAGKPTKAIQHYQQALRINPDFTAARNALARVQGGQ